MKNMKYLLLGMMALVLPGCNAFVNYIAFGDKVVVRNRAEAEAILIIREASERKEVEQ